MLSHVGIVLLGNIVLSIVGISGTADVFQNILTYQGILDGVFIFYLLVISLIAVIRGRSWWNGKNKAEIVKQAKRKVKWFLATVGSMILLIAMAVALSVVPLDYPFPGTHLSTT